MNAKCDSETGGLLKYFKGITLLNGVGFLLLVTGCGGGGAANTTSPPPALPVLSLSSSQDPVQVNTELVLTWSSSNATSCSASGDWSGNKALSGDEKIWEEVAGSKIYSLSCSGAGGEQSMSIEVEITPAPDLTVSRTQLPRSHLSNPERSLLVLIPGYSTFIAMRPTPAVCLGTTPSLSWNPLIISVPRHRCGLICTAAAMAGLMRIRFTRQ